MKIVVISNLYPPLVQGGAEVVAQRMVKGLIAAGHTVSVITTRRFSLQYPFKVEGQADEAVVVYRFYPLNIYHYLSAPRVFIFLRPLWHLINLCNVHSATVVKRILKIEKPEVVITHNLMGIGFLIPRTIHRLGIRHIHVLHDVQLYNPSGVILLGHENSALQRLTNILGYPRWMRWLFRYADALITPSQFLKSFYLERGFFRQRHQTITVLPNPVVLPTMKQREEGERPFCIASIGSVSEAKGIPQACEALAPVLGRYNAHYDVVGGGSALSELRRHYQANRHITFHGSQAPAALDHFYRTADLIVVPSMLYDASPTVIYEAFSYGVPVVAAASGGASEIIQEGINGWLFKPGDWNALAGLVASAASSKEKLLAMGAAARRSVEPLSVEHYTQKLIQVIQK